MNIVRLVATCIAIIVIILNIVDGAMYYKEWLDFKKSQEGILDDTKVD